MVVLDQGAPLKGSCLCILKGNVTCHTLPLSSSLVLDAAGGLESSTKHAANQPFFFSPAHHPFSPISPVLFALVP